MFKKLLKIKNIDEVLGLGGLIYLAILAAITFLLVNFLVGSLRDSLISRPSEKPLPPTFNFDLTE